MHLTPSDWDPLIIWDIATKLDIPQGRYPHIQTLALLSASTSGGDIHDTDDMMDEESVLHRHPSSDAILAREAFRTKMHGALHTAFSTGAIGLEWPVQCLSADCSWEAARDGAERRYRALAFDVCSDLAEDIIGSSEIVDSLCVSCREAVPRAGERLREQVWAWLCREDGEDLEDPFVVLG